jgi:2-polyprenyl-3-methyl-5-hydroxy-6-metoxy-1,4-benzoquinol methylase
MNNNNDGITFLSEPMQVNMADDWYSHVSAEHFWIKRRQNVLLHLLKNTDLNQRRWLDVGCGTGDFQHFLYTSFRISAFGADLNLHPLQRNTSGKQFTLCYDINERAPQLEASFDIISILDVIEHITDDQTFFESLLFHLKPGGIIIGNVPAFEIFFSKYDRLVGHERRYSIQTLKRYLAGRSTATLKSWTYWGMPLVPIILARKILSRFANDDVLVKNGILPPTPLVASVLSNLSRMEKLSNHFFGTSLAFIFEKTE